MCVCVAHNGRQQMTVTQETMEKWVEKIGHAHGKWESEMVKDFFLLGYESAWKHAAKHAVEKVLEVARDVLNLDEYDALETVLSDPETWR
jgi:hypothetical protein